MISIQDLPLYNISKSLWSSHSFTMDMKFTQVFADKQVSFPTDFYLGIELV